LLLTGALTISEVLGKDAYEEVPMESSGSSPANAGTGITDPPDLLQRVTVQTTELRGEVIRLADGFKQCGQAYTELLEAAAARLDSLVMPARYRR